MRIEKKICNGSAKYDNVCNHLTGEWVRYQKLGKYEKNLFEQFKDKSYIEFDDHNCDDADLQERLSQVKGTKKSDFICNTLTGKWKKIGGQKFILNPALDLSLPEFNVPNSVYNYYKMKKRNEYLKDDAKCGMSKGKRVVLKKYLDIAAQEWSEIKKTHGDEYIKIEKEFNDLIQKRDKLLKEKGLELHIAVPIIETGRLHKGEFNGFSFFNHQNQKTNDKNLSIISQTSRNKELWKKMSIEEKNKWALKALEYNKTISAGQTQNELLAAKNIKNEPVIIIPSSSLTKKTQIRLSKKSSSKKDSAIKSPPASLSKSMTESSSKKDSAIESPSASLSSVSSSKPNSKSNSKSVSKSSSFDYEIKKKLTNVLHDDVSNFLKFVNDIGEVNGQHIKLTDDNVDIVLDIYKLYNKLSEDKKNNFMEKLNNLPTTTNTDVKNILELLL